VSCTNPIEHARLVDYWSRDLSDTERDAIEEHLFGCDSCTNLAERVARLVEAIRHSLPPVIAQSDLDALRASGRRVVENDFAPGVRTEVTFERDIDFLIHHLRGLALADAERVSITVRTETSGMTLFEEPFAPFDRSRGEVLIACQRHFAAMPRDVVFDVRVFGPSSSEPSLATFSIPHIFVE
jgi:hypothetical protein